MNILKTFATILLVSSFYPSSYATSDETQQPHNLPGLVIGEPAPTRPVSSTPYASLAACSYFTSDLSMAMFGIKQEFSPWGPTTVERPVGSYRKNRDELAHTAESVFFGGTSEQAYVYYLTASEIYKTKVDLKPWKQKFQMASINPNFVGRPKSDNELRLLDVTEWPNKVIALMRFSKFYNPLDFPLDNRADILPEHQLVSGADLDTAKDFMADNLKSRLQSIFDGVIRHGYNNTLNYHFLKDLQRAMCECNGQKGFRDLGRHTTEVIEALSKPIVIKNPNPTGQEPRTHWELSPKDLSCGAV